MWDEWYLEDLNTPGKTEALLQLVAAQVESLRTRKLDIEKQRVPFKRRRRGAELTREQATAFAMAKFAPLMQRARVVRSDDRA